MENTDCVSSKVFFANTLRIVHEYDRQSVAVRKKLVKNHTKPLVWCVANTVSACLREIIPTGPVHSICRVGRISCSVHGTGRIWESVLHSLTFWNAEGDKSEKLIDPARTSRADQFSL